MLTYRDIFRMEDELGALTNVKVSVHTPGEFGPRSRKRIDVDLKEL